MSDNTSTQPRSKPKGGRTDLSDLTNAVGHKSSVDGANARPAAHNSGAPLKVPLADLTSNPRNPRNSIRNLEQLASITEHQLQPATAVTRAAFLKLYPEAEITGKWVVIHGNRRLAAAHKFGRVDLEIVVKDELAKDRSTLLASALKENLDRDDLDIIEEAQGVERLVDECGSAAAAAHQLGKSEGWVSQRRQLLTMDPELQEGLRRGEIAVRDMRELARVPRVQQVAAWAAMQEKKKRPVGEGSGSGSDSDKSAKAQLRSVTRALNSFEREPNQLAEALHQYLGDDGLKTLMTALRRIK